MQHTAYGCVLNSLNTPLAGGIQGLGKGMQTATYKPTAVARRCGKQQQCMAGGYWVKHTAELYRMKSDSAGLDAICA